MGLQYTNFFENKDYETDTQIIICKECSSHLCLSSLIISDSFSGSSGPAYLVDKLINFTTEDNLEETQMKTGIYLIKKVKCHQCLNVLGWTYKRSYNYRESYKEGKFVIEKAYIKTIDNNSSTKNLIESARKNYRRRLSSNSTINSCELDDLKDIKYMRSGLNDVKEDEKVLVEL